jgi:hypothetical protein
MLFDWNENGLETHGDIQVERRCARTARASERGCGLIALFTRDRWERSGTPGLSIAPASKLIANSYLTSDSRFCPSAVLTGRGEAGNCNTVARWPSHSRVSNTVSPSGNSSAS